MEAESGGVCERAGRPGAFSNFLSGFFGTDVSDHQRFAAD
jgi:hypothetical protein